MPSVKYIITLIFPPSAGGAARRRQGCVCQNLVFGGSLLWDLRLTLFTWGRRPTPPQGQLLSRSTRLPHSFRRNWASIKDSNTPARGTPRGRRWKKVLLALKAVDLATRLP